MIAGPNDSWEVRARRRMQYSSLRVWPGGLSTFTEGTGEEKQAGCTRRLRLGPAESVPPAVLWPCLQSPVGVLARSPNSSSCPCLTSHHVLATSQLLLNSGASLPACLCEACSPAARGYVPTSWGCSQVCLPPRHHPLPTSQQTVRKPRLPGQWSL